MRRAGHNSDKEVNLSFVRRKKNGIRQQIPQVRRTDIRDRTHVGHELHYDIGVTLPIAANKDTKNFERQTAIGTASIQPISGFRQTITLITLLTHGRLNDQ